MKNLKFLLLLLPPLLSIGCNRNDDPVTDEPALTETWNLINVSGSITGASYDFDPGTIKWTFHGQAVVVVNNNTDESAEDMFQSGTYSMHYETNEATPEMCGQILFVDDIELGCATVTENQIVISQVWADGYQLTFVK
ncbi:hypothetical protein AAEO56_09250 [Flavobacterium sp. DGU11]|uniref:Lipocalin-like domain-containing protein n=1 Tax=Flavobacterium arundinis TaxID=3139143 RepID=A0ABU9HW98_9FLAO